MCMMTYSHSKQKQINKQVYIILKMYKEQQINENNQYLDYFKLWITQFNREVIDCNYNISANYAIQNRLIPVIKIFVDLRFDLNGTRIQGFDQIIIFIILAYLSHFL
ncbi:hypothetical protein FGO68_gene12976 [Halteria grandinella]|uniref:Uncharacterized protein n=1 Tax=Halteria grandinella TaxID=5974 RepID=A0A8J8NHJ7_HALGN|nr:hypothetical protein FGO68_gene12976 [Halteria grandinella]